jgi:hypothetical protein
MSLRKLLPGASWWHSAVQCLDLLGQRQFHRRFLFRGEFGMGLAVQPETPVWIGQLRWSVSARLTPMLITGCRNFTLPAT